MEYSITAFTNKLIELFVNSKYMPNMKGAYTNKYGITQLDSSKHKSRPEPRDLKNQIERSMNTTMAMDLNGEGQISFNIGNEFMELNFPYYHILQQAPVIRKKDQGTTKTKGSLMYEKDKAKRDYEQVHWNGKTFTKEYEKNVRGSRVNLYKTSLHIDGQFLNMEQKQYLNIHYKYIDNILNKDVVDQLAAIFGMKRKRTEDTGFIDEFAYQLDTDTATVLKAFDSLL